MQNQSHQSDVNVPSNGTRTYPGGDNLPTDKHKLKGTKLGGVKVEEKSSADCLKEKGKEGAVSRGLIIKSKIRNGRLTFGSQKRKVGENDKGRRRAQKGNHKLFNGRAFDGREW